MLPPSDSEDDSDDEPVAAKGKSAQVSLIRRNYLSATHVLIIQYVCVLSWQATVDSTERRTYCCDIYVTCVQPATAGMLPPSDSDDDSSEEEEVKPKPKAAAAKPPKPAVAPAPKK